MTAPRGRRIGALAAVALLAVLVTAPAALAACPQTSVADVEDEVMCPVCGTPLALAQEAPQAKRERAFIQRQVDACRSKEEIKSALAAEFGPDVLALPDERGFGLAAYLVPALLLVAAGAGIALAVGRWGRRGGGPGGEGPAAGPDDRRRVDAELARLDL